MTPSSRTDILLIGQNAQLHQALQDAGFSTVRLEDDSDLYAAVAHYAPGAILLHADAPSRDTLEHLAALNRRYPQPAVVLHDGSNAELTRQALQLGISAYVAEGLSAAAMKALIEISIEHARQLQTLRQELSRKQKSLAEKKLINAAKCRLMERHGLCEQAAFESLKTTAMNARISLPDAARRMLSADKD